MNSIDILKFKSNFRGVGQQLVAFWKALGFASSMYGT